MPSSVGGLRAPAWVRMRATSAVLTLLRVRPRLTFGAEGPGSERRRDAAASPAGPCCGFCAPGGRWHAQRVAAAGGDVIAAVFRRAGRRAAPQPVAHVVLALAGWPSGLRRAKGANLVPGLVARRGPQAIPALRGVPADVVGVDGADLRFSGIGVLVAVCTARLALGLVVLLAAGPGLYQAIAWRRRPCRGWRPWRRLQRLLRLMALTIRLWRVAERFGRLRDQVLQQLLYFVAVR